MTHLVRAFTVAAFAAVLLAGCKDRPAVVEPPPNGGGGNGKPDPAAQKQLQELRLALTNAQTERDQALQQVAMYDAELQKERGAVLEARKAADTASGERDRVRARADDLQGKLDALNRRVTELGVQIGKLQDDLERARMGGGGTVPPVLPTDPTVEPLPAERPEPAAGMKRQAEQAGFSFDYPDGWNVEVTYTMDNTVYTVTSPDGASQARITVYGWITGEPEQLVQELYLQKTQELSAKDIVPTPEEELSAVAQGLAGSESWATTIRYDRAGTPIRHRLLGANLSPSNNAYWYSFLVELTWPASDDDAAAKLAQIAQSFWLQ